MAFHLRTFQKKMLWIVPGTSCTQSRKLSQLSLWLKGSVCVLTPPEGAWFRSHLQRVESLLLHLDSGCYSE